MAYRLVTNLEAWGELWPTFAGSKIFPQGISHTLFFGAQQNLAVLGVVWPIDTYCQNLVNFGLLFQGQKFLTVDICHTICQSMTKFGSTGVWQIDT